MEIGTLSKLWIDPCTEHPCLILSGARKNNTPPCCCEDISFAERNKTRRAEISVVESGRHGVPGSSMALVSSIGLESCPRGQQSCLLRWAKTRVLKTDTRVSKRAF